MKKRKVNNGRIYFICILFLLCWGIIIQKLFSLQIQHNVRFQVLADSQQEYTNTIGTARGIITSSDGVELAVNAPSYTAYVYIPNITNMHSFTSIILAKLGGNVGTFDQEEHDGLTYFQIAQNVSPTLKDTIDTLTQTANNGSVEFVLSEKRLYPNGSLLAQVLGFVDNSGDGQYGIEGYFDGDLKGVAGTIQGDKDQYGNPILNANLTFIPPTPGEDITLTINANLQEVVEDRLKSWVDKEAALAGSVIVMNPQTGAIEAMASYPTFDPNAYYNGYITDCNAVLFQQSCANPSQKLNPSTVQNAFSNMATSFTYEPGSVMKAITASAALQDNIITPQTTVDDTTGYYEADTKKVYNWNLEPDGVMNMAQILKLSSNVGASMIASKVGKIHLYDFYKAYGIGSLTGITLQGEETQSLPPAATWDNIDLATASFGQYVAATPLQVLDIYQTIANQGLRMKPYIVQSVDKNGETVNTTPQVVQRVISADTAKTLTNMLTYATTGDPQLGLTMVKPYISMIASKTGTAQIPLPDQSGYYNNLINATYVGYAPATNPKFVMLVMLQEPANAQFAYESAVPAWGSIAQYLFSYYKIPPQ